MKPILIIDADWNFGRLLTQNLRREGYFVIQASNFEKTLVVGITVAIHVIIIMGSDNHLGG